MKIVALTAENVKKLRAVEIKPSGTLVAITGKNGQGKTSVLDAIWWALAGTTHIQAAPIRKGESKARIRLDLGEIVVERRFTDKGSTLTVESAEGARYPSPQKMLDALLGALTFDPLAFVGQEPKKQFETLRGIVKLEVDFDELDGLNRSDFDKRTDVNRQAKALRAQAEGIAVAANLPAEPIDTQALMDEMAGAAKVNAEIETRKGRRDSAASEIAEKRRVAAEKRERARRLREEADVCDQSAAVYEGDADTLQKKLDDAEPLPEPVNVDAVRAKLADAQAKNAEIAKRERRAELAKQAEALEAQSKDLTDKMAAREQAKAEAIAKAKMPVDGLGFGEGIVTFGGVPFEQASTAEQIRVSLAIAMAANPKLKVIRIKEGSMLDADNLALVAKMAEENGYQVWMERVDSSGKVGIFIEDGAVTAIDGTPVPRVETAEASA